MTPHERDDVIAQATRDAAADDPPPLTPDQRDLVNSVMHDAVAAVRRQRTP